MSVDVPPESLDDSALVARIAEGRLSGAVEELHRQHASSLLAFLSARGVRQRADLEDLHQEIWLRVLDRAPRQFHGGNFRAWVFTIARNLLTDSIRQRKAVPDANLHQRIDEREQPVIEGIIDQERCAALERCLSRLSPAARELVQRRLAGESYPELCRQMGIERSEAYKTWHTAFGQLSECVQRAET